MNQRQLASVLLAAVGVFIVLLQLQESGELVGALISSTMVDDTDPSVEAARVTVSVSLLGLVLAVLAGSMLVLFRDRVANLLFPPATASLSASEVQAVALSVLGCYFAVEGLSRLVRMGTFDWGSATRLVLGILLFFGARGLARLWSSVRGAGQGADVGQKIR